MSEALEAVRSRLVDSIASFEFKFTEEYFDFAIEIQKRLPLIGEDKKVQKVLNKYFKEYFSNIGYLEKIFAFLEKGITAYPPGSGIILY